MLTYTQVEAIHEAMRECEPHADRQVILGRPYEVYDAQDVDACFAKIRAALAGESTSPVHGPLRDGGV